MERVSAQHKSSLQIGELFMEEGLISSQDMKRALEVQEKSLDSQSRGTPRLFGMILCDLNLVTPVDIYHVLKKNNTLMTLQEYLETRNILSFEAIRQAERRSSETGVPLISVLLEDDIVPRKQLAQILMDLFHIPLRSISDFVFNKTESERLASLISKEEAGINGVIPLLLQGKSLLCGITDPDNLLFIRELSERFPLYRFEALFIPFSGFSWFYQLLYDETHAISRGKETAKEKSMDLSLLLEYEAVIKDPVIEKEGVLALYERYELLRRLLGSKGVPDRQVAFHTFIMEKHESITRKFQCRAIRFSLENDQGQVLISAFPEHQEEHPWQK